MYPEAFWSVQYMFLEYPAGPTAAHVTANRSEQEPTSSLGPAARLASFPLLATQHGYWNG